MYYSAFTFFVTEISDRGKSKFAITTSSETFHMDGIHMNL